MTLTRYTRPQGIWTMMDDLMDMHSTLDTLLGGKAGTDGFTPVMNAYGSSDQLVLELEMPGVDPKDADIQIVDDVLTVKAKRELAELPENQSWLRQERPAGEWSRSMKLPFKVEVAKVAATSKNGILRISLPRTEAEKPKRIEIHAG